jgi:hypothetical protein
MNGGAGLFLSRPGAYSSTTLPAQILKFVRVHAFAGRNGLMFPEQI